MHKYKSSYITEVMIESSYISLKDSCNNTYYIDKENIEAISQFKIWFSSIFSKGIP